MNINIVILIFRLKELYQSDLFSKISTKTQKFINEKNLSALPDNLKTAKRTANFPEIVRLIKNMLELQAVLSQPESLTAEKEIAQKIKEIYSESQMSYPPKIVTVFDAFYDIDLFFNNKVHETHSSSSIS